MSGAAGIPAVHGREEVKYGKARRKRRDCEGTRCAGANAAPEQGRELSGTSPKMPDGYASPPHWFPYSGLPA